MTTRLFVGKDANAVFNLCWMMMMTSHLDIAANSIGLAFKVKGF